MKEMNKLKTANSKVLVLADSLGIPLSKNNKGNVSLTAGEFVIKGPENVGRALHGMLRPTPVRLRHGRPDASQSR